MIIDKDKQNEYLKNIVRYLYLTCNRIKYNDLKVLCNDVFNIKSNIEFSNDEIKLANDIINDNDYKSFIDFINDKKPITMEVDKETFLGKIDNLWEFIMHNAYEVWQNNNMTREEFLSSLTPYEEMAVKFGNFNYQVENGGLMQWDLNGYSEDLEYLQEFLSNCDYLKRNKFLEILESFSTVKDAIGNLNKYDDWYDEDENTRWKSLDVFDKEYYSFKDDWNEFFQEYLFINMPNDYAEKIKEHNQKIDI